jgi:hypothetical protein
VDPDVAETGQPYAYAGDDPVNESDPLGLFGLSDLNPVHDAEALGNAATTAWNDTGGKVVSYVASHPLQTLAIVGGVVVVVGATILTGGLADVLVATAAGLTEEGTAIGSLEAVDLAIHAPFVLLPGITLGGLGGAGIAWGIYSLVTNSTHPKNSCP